MRAKFLTPIVGTVTDIVRNRVLNQHTPTGIKLAIGAGVLFYGLTEAQANLLIALFSGKDITTFGVWVWAFNAGGLFLFYKSIMFVAKKIDKFADSPGKKSDKSDNNMSFSRINF